MMGRLTARIALFDTCRGLAPLALGLLLLSCGKDGEGGKGTGQKHESLEGTLHSPAQPASQPSGPAETPIPAEPVMRVHEIVFLEQVDSCECTQKRQEATWENLKAELDQRKVKPPVKVVAMDRPEDDSEYYMALEPTMVMPGLYFLDANGLFVGHLQGEVPREQIEEMLHRE